MTYADLAGIPWKVGGMDYDGVDCLGLAYLAQRDLYGNNLDISYIYKEDNILRMSKIIMQEMTKFAAPVDIPLMGDVAILKFRASLHIATYVDSDLLLHTSRNKESRLVRLSGGMGGFLHGFYRVGVNKW
jgi:cell wall-associated NlpC family hydrolase